MPKKLIKEIEILGNPEKAKNAKRFFKDSYTETEFLGLNAKEQKDIAKKYLDLPLSKIQKLLNSKTHEQRMIAGIILVEKFKKNPEEIFNFYIKNAKKFNNWDLVDTTAHKIVGKFLLEKKKKILYDFSKSKNLWEKRIAIVSTLEFIRNNNFGDTLKISEILLDDKHDLIHKAIGWMLREVGKRDIGILNDFLKTNYNKLPRTTLRYAIEMFEEKDRKKFLKGKF